MISYRTACCAKPHRSHYWHFMAGYFLPVVSQEIISRQVFVKDCGQPMNKHWETIKDREFKIGFPQNHDPINLENYDRPNCGNITRVGIKRFQEVFWRNVGIPKVSKRPKYTLIDRGHQPQFYDRVKRISASSRRHIQKIDEFHKELNAYRKFNLHYLENMPLSEQAKLFYTSDVIVLQHGAAMFNVIFCRPSTIVIELAKDCWRYYGKWSSLCRIRRTALPEAFNQKPSAKNIIRAIKQADNNTTDIIDI